MNLSTLEIQKKFPTLSFQDLIKVLEFVTKSEKEKLLASGQINLSSAQLKKIDIIVKRLKNEEPIDYILGYKYFYDNKFLVSPAVLIPRPETELLVDFAISIISTNKKQSIDILEIGTGGGCISISILNALNTKKKELGNKTVTIYATDISTKALEVAKKNALLLLSPRLNQSLKLLEADILPKNMKTQFDIIISNPPYIPSHLVNKLDKSVRNYEPINALDGGKDGIDFYKVILERTKVNQKSDSIVLFEVDETSIKTLKTYLNKQKLKYEVHDDFRGHPRIIKIY
jgi:release factor glutamine methyltransferase